MRDETDGDGLAEEAGALPPSLLPYEQWIEQAYREVMIKALTHAQAEGLPGAHHFYVTFRTTARGVQIPTRLLAQYPQEMTIVLQHQFWDLKVDRTAGMMSVGLSFGSVPSTLVIPFSAITGFADPQVRLVLRFTVPETESQPAEPVRPEAKPPEVQAPAKTEAASAEPPATDEADSTPQVVSLDAFRRRGPPA
jgi:uncharacterized protein